MLSIKLKNPHKKVKKSSPALYDLFLGNSRWTKPVVSSKQVLNTLISLHREGVKGKEKAETKLDNLNLDNISKDIVINGKIVESFTVKVADGKEYIDNSSFLIDHAYLPNDDDAPERIYEIASAFHDAVLQANHQKAEFMSQEMNKVPNGYLTFSSDNREYSNAQLKRCVDGEFEIVNGNIKTQEVVELLHYLAFNQVNVPEQTYFVSTKFGDISFCGTKVEIDSGDSEVFETMKEIATAFGFKVEEKRAAA